MGSSELRRPSLIPVYGACGNNPSPMRFCFSYLAHYATVYRGGSVGAQDAAPCRVPLRSYCRRMPCPL